MSAQIQGNVFKSGKGNNTKRNNRTLKTGQEHLKQLRISNPDRDLNYLEKLEQLSEDDRGKTKILAKLISIHQKLMENGNSSQVDKDSVYALIYILVDNLKLIKRVNELQEIMRTTLKDLYDGTAVKLSPDQIKKYKEILCTEPKKQKNGNSQNNQQTLQRVQDRLAERTQLPPAEQTQPVQTEIRDLRLLEGLLISGRPQDQRQISNLRRRIRL